MSVSYKIFLLYLISTVLLFLPVLVLAQSSNSFSVAQQIGSDNSPPTIPAPVNASAVTSSQINVTWGASIDDQNLSGYRVFRDGLHVATTSLTSYSDTGLTASTTYSYTVEAFDWFYNISTTSASAAATTLPSSTGGSGTHDYGTQLKVRLLEFDVETTRTEAAITWKTNIYARYSLRWGKVDAYDLGFVQTDAFKKSHETYIPDLEPGTTYVYELIAYNQQGKEFSLSDGTFTTEALADTLAPSNVSDFSAVVEEDSVRLFWENPLDIDFDKVRVVRSSNSYPRDPLNGYVVYEGDATTFFDKDALRIHSSQYYSIFTYDGLGNISSGAVVFVQRRGGDESDGLVSERLGNGFIAESPSKAKNIPVEYSKIDFLDVEVYQENIRIFADNGKVYVVSGVPLRMQIPYELFPEHLKTILVTIENGQMQPVSYMLRINKDKTAYAAMLPPVNRLGAYDLTFSIYDYQTQLLSTFVGMMQVEEISSVSQFTKLVFVTQWNVWTVVFRFLILFLILAILFYIFFWRRRRE